eukprot:COSAG01_NODE_1315_length_10757_cov_13.246669_9_plen_476_part_00
MRGEAAEALGALTAEVRGLGRRLEALEVAGGAVDRSPQALDARLRRIERMLSLEPAAAGREEPMPALDESSVRPETGGLQADGGGYGAGSDSLYARALWSDGEAGVLLPLGRRRRKEGLYRCVRAAVLRASEERGSERIGRLEVGDIVRAEWWENEPYGGCQGAAATRVHCIAPGRDWLPCVGLRRLQAGGAEGQQGGCCLTGWASVTAGGGRALLVALSERVLPLPEGGPGASYVARVRVQLRDRPAVSSAAVGAGGVIAAGGRVTVEEVAINEAGQTKLRLSLAGGSGWASFVGISNHQPLFTAAGGLEEEEAAAGLPPPSKDPTGEADEGGRQRSTSVGGGGAQWVAGLKRQAVEVEELRLRMDAMERRHAEEVKQGELGRRLEAMERAMERAMEPPPPPPQAAAAAAMAAGPGLLPLRDGGAPVEREHEGAAISGGGGVGTEGAEAAAASSAAAALLVSCVLRQVEDEWTI